MLPEINIALHLSKFCNYGSLTCVLSDCKGTRRTFRPVSFTSCSSKESSIRPSIQSQIPRICLGTLEENRRLIFYLNYTKIINKTLNFIEQIFRLHTCHLTNTSLLRNISIVHAATISIPIVINYQ